MTRDEKGAFLKLAQHDPEKPDAPWEDSRPKGWSEKVGYGVDATKPQVRAGAPYVDKEERSRRGMGRGTWDPAVQPWTVTPRKTAPEMPDVPKKEKPDPDDEPFHARKPKKPTGRGDPVDFRPAHERASGQTARLRADVPDPPGAIREARGVRDAELRAARMKKEPKKERKVRFTPGLQAGPSRPTGRPVLDTKSIMKREKEIAAGHDQFTIKLA